MKKIFNIFSIILLYLLISSFGLPVIADLLLFLILFLIIKFDFYSIIIMNSLLILMIILTNTFIKKDNSTNGNFYRAHEKFVADESIYKKNVSSEILMPHGDIVALDICNNINNLAQPRKQLFITDKYG